VSSSGYGPIGFYDHARLMSSIAKAFLAVSCDFAWSNRVWGNAEALIYTTAKIRINVLNLCG
jgi:hypothetical protein